MEKKRIMIAENSCTYFKFHFALHITLIFLVAWRRRSTRQASKETEEVVTQFSCMRLNCVSLFGAFVGGQY